MPNPKIEAMKRWWLQALAQGGLGLKLVTTNADSTKAYLQTARRELKQSGMTELEHWEIRQGHGSDELLLVNTQVAQAQIADYIRQQSQDK